MRLLLAALLSLASTVHAQDGPVRILVGFAPGGGADLIARLAADKMKDTLGVPVLVENRPGAGGQLAADLLRTSPADGRTIMASPVAVTVIAPLTFRRLSYVPDRDFAPLSHAVNFQLALTSGPAAGVQTLKDYVAWLKADARRGTYGIPAAGSLPHFFGVQFARAIGMDLQHVPYKGGGPMLNDLVGGALAAGFDVLSEALPLHRAGKVRILATSGEKRSPMASDIPTFTELGFPQIQGNGWFGFHARAGTPPAVLEKLSAAAAAAIRAPDVNERLLAIGFEPVGSTAEGLAQRMREDRARWEPIVKASGYVAD